MSTEAESRSRQLARFFGTAMLLAQLWVLAVFVDATWDEVSITGGVTRVELFSRMAWLKASLWRPTRFLTWCILLALLCVGIASWLCVAAIRHWRRALRQEQP